MLSSIRKRFCRPRLTASEPYHATPLTPDIWHRDKTLTPLPYAGAFLGSRRRKLTDLEPYSLRPKIRKRGPALEPNSTAHSNLSGIVLGT